MAEFINTVDVIGDAAVMRSIIDSSITEYNDNVITTLRDYAFYDCQKLVSVDLPEVTNILDNVFYNCTVLSTVNFPKVNGIGSRAFRYCSTLATVNTSAVTSIGSAAFEGCYKLTALILRNTSGVASLYNTSVFNMTPMQSSGSYSNINYGTGYIYVPRALVDSYKAATNWSTYASQFRALEDYTVDGTVTGALDTTKI